jgi:hypothetical protein
MSRRIVSWWINEPCVSSASAVSINTVVSEIITDATGVKLAEIGARLNARVTRSANPTSDDSFVRHDIYFFEDGNITFLVRNALYCAHRLLKRL